MYQLSLNNTQFFGNITLNQFHMFSRYGNKYLFVVDEVECYNITDEEGDLILEVFVNSDKLITFEELRILKKYKLVPCPKSKVPNFGNLKSNK